MCLVTCKEQVELQAFYLASIAKTTVLLNDLSRYLMLFLKSVVFITLNSFVESKK